MVFSWVGCHSSSAPRMMAHRLLSPFPLLAWSSNSDARWGRRGAVVHTWKALYLCDRIAQNNSLLLSNNKELLCRLCWIMPSESLTTGSLICAKPTRRRDQSTNATLHKSTPGYIITNQVFIHESKVFKV
jgi:hypothetical protein